MEINMYIHIILLKLPPLVQHQLIFLEWGFICVVLLISIIFPACKSQNKSDEPEIKAVFTVSKLSDEDFEDIGSTNAVKEDFRKINFSLNVNNCSNITNRKIAIPNLKELMNSYDIERYWYGQYTSSDSLDEDALYSYDIMFLSKGLTDKNINPIFNDAKIIITWTDKKGKEIKSSVNLTDIIEFK